MKVMLVKLLNVINRIYLFLNSSSRRTLTIAKDTLVINLRIKSDRDNMVVIGENVKIQNSMVLIKGQNSSVKIQPNSSIRNCNIIIKGNNCEVILGSEIQISHLNTTLEGPNNHFTLGDKTSINGETEIYVKEEQTVKIGRDCMFSRGIVIRTTDSHSIIDQSGKRINLSKPVIIGDHVWIGQNVMIMKGAVLLENSVVAAGTIVTKPQLEKNSIIAGNPGKVIKRGVNWKRELS